MAAAHVDLVIDQGEDWSCQIYWTDFYNNPHKLAHPLRMEIRSSLGQTIHTLNSDEDFPAGSIEPIAWSNETGWIQLHIPEESTKTFPPGIYSYDLFVSVNDGAVYAGHQQVRLIYGSMTVNARVTQGI